MNDELRKVIQLENSLLSLSERRKEKGQEVEDTKDLMRKIRENVYKPAHSLYCFSHGVAVKRRLNELYPFMEKQLKQALTIRSQLEAQLLGEITTVSQLLREGKIAGQQLDYRVRQLIEEYDTKYEGF